MASSFITEKSQVNRNPETRNAVRVIIISFFFFKNFFNKAELINWLRSIWHSVWCWKQKSWKSASCPVVPRSIPDFLLLIFSSFFISYFCLRYRALWSFIRVYESVWYLVGYGCPIINMAYISPMWFIASQFHGGSDKRWKVNGLQLKNGMGLTTIVSRNFASQLRMKRKQVGHFFANFFRHIVYKRGSSFKLDRVFIYNQQSLLLYCSLYPY